MTKPGGAHSRPTEIWLLAAASLAASLAFLVMRVATPSDGAIIPYYANALTIDGVRLGPVDPGVGGLASGDVVTMVDGRSVGSWLDSALDPGLDRSAIGEAEMLTYGVRRAGATLDVPVMLARQDVVPILLDNWTALLFTIVLQVVAAAVLWRRPQASAATALVVAACGVTGSTLPWLLGLQVSDIVRGWPFVFHAFTVSGLYMLLWPAGALHLTLALTGGQPGGQTGGLHGPSRRALALAYGIPLGAYVAGLAASRVVSSSPTAWLGTWPIVQLLVIIPTLLVGMVLVAVRYRATPVAERNPIRWAALGGGAAMLGALLLLLGPELLTGRPLVPWTMVGIIALPLPLGIAAGILRYRLFDIEVVVRRSVVYGTLTLAVIAVYAGVFAVLGAIIGRADYAASLLATGAAALVAIPLRDLLQKAVGRLLFGDRDDPYRALTRLGERLEGTLDPIEAPSVIVRTVAESLRLPWVGLRIDQAGVGSRVIAHGRDPGGSPVEVPLVYGLEVVGGLLVAPRTPDEPLSLADRQLLDALARQAGSAVHAMRLTLDLVASRERLVAAREEERRRIRRDLHDGLGPTLAAIGMRAEAAAALAARDPRAAEALLGELRTEVQGALAEIRRLVDALRPPALDELGLVGALRQQAERLAADVELDVDAAAPLPRLTAAVEVAAYRIAAEAMTNVARHSRAHRCRVSLAADGNGDNATLVVEVIDDGDGMPALARPGIGIVSMRERAAEVGGTCLVESPPTGGTRVVARLPLGGGAAT